MKRILLSFLFLMASMAASAQLKLSGFSIDNSIDGNMRLVVVDSVSGTFYDYQVKINSMLAYMGSYVQGGESEYALPIFSGGSVFGASNIVDSTNVGHCVVNDTMIVMRQLRLGNVGMAALVDSPLVMGATKKDIRKINPPVGEYGVIFHYPGDTVLADTTFLATENYVGRQLAPYQVASVTAATYVSAVHAGPGISIAGTLTPTITATNNGTVTSVTAGSGLSGGTITTTGTISLPSVGTAGTYGSATTIPQLTTDAYGRVSAVTAVAMGIVTAFTVNAQTGTTYTFVLGDAGKMVTGTNSSTQTYTIPPNSSVAFPVNTFITIAALGSGKVTIVGGSGVTVLTTDTNQSVVQNGTIFIWQVSANSWVLGGKSSN